MGKVNINQLEKVETLPFRCNNFNNRKYRHYFHSEDNPWKSSKRIVKNNIGKSFSLAFSYFCSKFEQRYYKEFLELFKSTYRRFDNPDYYIDDNGLIQTNIEPKERKPIIVYSKDYKTENYNILTGLPIIKIDWKYIKGKYRKIVYGKEKKNKWFKDWYYLNDNLIGERIISGSKQVFESRNDPRYIRITSERDKQLKIQHKLEKSKRWKISNEEFRRLLKEKELKERQLNLIKIESHGFDINTSFRK